MEKKDRPYAILPYNPIWKEQYEENRKIISGVFKEKALSIEHIGSTSVEGMWAKPQIDILVLVRDLGKIDKLIPEMKSKGFTYQEEFFTKNNEKYFTSDATSGERLVSVHVLQKDDPRAISHINFRDYLREHPNERDLYSKTKREAYENGVDRMEYIERKKEVLNILLKKAKEWADSKP